MSFEAMQWAMSQRCGKSSAKFILLALASFVDEKDRDVLCWPSVRELCDVTDQDRKTVLGNLRHLRDVGLIQDTGRRQGISGQVIVYQLANAGAALKGSGARGAAEEKA